MKKRVFSLFIAIVMLMSLTVLPASAEVYQGKYGSISWTFDDETGTTSNNLQNITIILYTSRLGVETLVRIEKPGLYTISVSTGEGENVATQQTIKVIIKMPNKIFFSVFSSK